MYNKKISYIFYRMGVLNLLHEILHSFGASHDQEGKRVDFFIIFIIFILLIKSHILSLEKNQSYKQLTYLFIFFSVRFMTWINSDKAMNGSYVHNILKHGLTIERCRNTHAFFVQKFVQSQTLIKEKLLKRLSYIKCSCKMLMKLTPVVGLIYEINLHFGQSKSLVVHVWHKFYCLEIVYIYWLIRDF